MGLVDFILTNARAAGLSDDQIAGILQSASRKLPGNVPEERYKEQIMTWINIRAKKNKDTFSHESSKIEQESERE